MGFSMDSIKTNIAIGKMDASAGAKSGLEPRHGKLPAKDTAITPSPDHAEFNPVRTKAYFSTYGSHNERLAIVVKNQETGEIIRQYPSEEMQALHAKLDILV